MTLIQKELQGGLDISTMSAHAFANICKIKKPPKQYSLEGFFNILRY